MASPWRSRRKLPLAAVLLMLIVGAYRGWQTSQQTEPESLDEGPVEIEYVIDGDTFVLKNQAKVRLLGIDCPETKHSLRGTGPEPFADEATQFTKDFVAKGEIRLRFDQERIDRFGRHLAYVNRGDVSLNEELVRAGLAKAKPHYNFASSFKRTLLAAQDEARAARRGIWADGPDSSDQ